MVDGYLVWRGAEDVRGSTGTKSLGRSMFSREWQGRNTGIAERADLGAVEREKGSKVKCMYSSM